MPLQLGEGKAEVTQVDDAAETAEDDAAKALKTKEAGVQTSKKLETRSIEIKNQILQDKSDLEGASIAEKAAETAAKKADKAEADTNAKMREAEALSGKTEAEYKQAYDEYAKTGQENAVDKANVENAKAQEEVDKTKLKTATSKRDNLKSRKETLKKTYDNAKDEYEKASKKYSELIGDVRKDGHATKRETRGQSEELEKSLKAMAQLDHAMSVALNTAKKAKESAAAAERAEAGVGKDREAAEAAKKRAEDTKKALEEARKNGTVTQAMVEAAKAAEDEASVAADKLEKSTNALVELKKQAEKDDEAGKKAEKKAESLVKLKDAEHALRQNLHEKMIIAEQEEKDSEKDLAKQILVTTDANLKYKAAQDKSMKMNSTIVETENKLGNEKNELQREEQVVEEVKGEHKDLAKKQSQAAQVDIPSQATVPEVSRILDDKKVELEHATTPLLKAIQAQKDALKKKDQIENKVKILATELTDEQLAAQNAAAKLASSKFEEVEAVNKKDDLKKVSDHLAETVQQEKMASAKLDATAKMVDEKVKVAEDVVQDDKRKIEQTGQAVANAMQQVTKEEAESKVVEKKVEKIEAEETQKLTVATPAPTNAPVVFKPEPFVEVKQSPTPPPTSMVEKLLKGNGKCEDHKDWTKNCERVIEYCDQFMAMKVYCKASCKLCVKKDVDNLLNPAPAPAPAPDATGDFLDIDTLNI